MKKNQKLLKRLEYIYSELKKAERQIKRQVKQMDKGSQRFMSLETTRAKNTIERLCISYCVCINEFKQENNEENENETEK